MESVEVYGVVDGACPRCKNVKLVPGNGYGFADNRPLEDKRSIDLVRRCDVPDMCMKCPQCGDSRSMTTEEYELYKDHYKRIEPSPQKVIVDDEGYLLQRVMPKDKITRIVDVSKMNIPRERQYDFWRKNADKRITKEQVMASYKNDYSNFEENPLVEEHYIQEMTQYTPYEESRDIFVWYRDIGALSGSAGYMRLRDGYVFQRTAVIRS